MLELRQTMSIPTAWVRLVFQGTVLKDPNETLATCQLFHDAELQLINEGDGLTEFSRKGKAFKNKINTLLETGHWSTSDG